jgi:hypothetical protein
MSSTKVTLGARILANLEEDAGHPVDLARKNAKKAGKEVYFNTVENLFARFKLYVHESANAGDFPAPLRLTLKESDALNTYSWKPGCTGPTKNHFCFALWEDFAHWATEEALVIEWQFGHDGVGMDSWWNLGIVLPKKGNGNSGRKVPPRLVNNP